MTISYKWLSEYLPVTVEPERLSRILTSIGLEVGSMTTFEEIKGGLKGLIIGEVLTAEKHPNADKLTLTTVHVGKENPLNIVCGAPNVAVGQKVVVAPVGETIYPTNGEPLTMSKIKIYCHSVMLNQYDKNSERILCRKQIVLFISILIFFENSLNITKLSI